MTTKLKSVVELNQPILVHSSVCNIGTTLNIAPSLISRLNTSFNLILNYGNLESVLTVLMQNLIK